MLRHRLAPAVLALTAVLAAHSGNAKQPPCPGGRWPVAQPLIGAAAGPDAVFIDDRQISIESGCPAKRARRVISHRTTVLRVRWPRCGDDRRVVLVVRLDNATCESLTGTLRKRGAKRRRLSAGVERPSDAFGKSTDPLPSGAELVSAEELAALQSSLPFHSASQGQAAADVAAAAQAAAADEATITGSLASGHMPAGDPSDPSTQEDGDRVLVVTDHDGGTREVTELGLRARRALLAAALRRHPTLDNQVDIYRGIYDFLKTLRAYSTLTPPDDVVPLGPARVKALNAGLADDVLVNVPPLIPGGTPPPGYPASCGAEEHAGDGTDRTERAADGTVSTPTPCPHLPSGIWSQLTWPLKFDATCVKQQAGRGTCFGFASTGALELLVAQKYARWVNLSEQFMFFMLRAFWYPDAFEDGVPWEAELQKQVDTGFAIPFEPDWDYNPSWSRVTNKAQKTYTGSCTGYGGAESAFCSDTSHQGRLLCIKKQLWSFCYWFPPPVVTPGATFRPTAQVQLWDVDEPNLSLALVVGAVRAFKKPVVLGYQVPTYHFKGDDDGFVPYEGPNCDVYQDDDGKWWCILGGGCNCPQAGHAVLVTGAVDNAELPGAIPPGAGGGYLVIKNSWGSCAGDGGYYYLPYALVKEFAVTGIMVASAT
jgi:hypothetical protein